MTYWVYLLQNSAGRFYVSQTENLEERLASHNRKDKLAGKFTRKDVTWSLVWSEPAQCLPPPWRANVKSKIGNLHG